MDDKKQQHQESSKRVAIIGLIGTLLTVCGGIAGVLIGGVTTIYKTEREVQKIALSAPQGDQPMTVDTRQIAINTTDAAGLDPSEYLVLQNLGFVMAQPHPGWNQVEEMLYQDLFFEEGTGLSPLILFSTWVKNNWDDQPLYRIRNAEPVMIQFIEGSTENGVQVDPTLLENDTLAFYSQMTILALAKDKAQDFTLYELALKWGILHQGGVNNIVANRDSQYVVEQVSWALKGVRVDGREANLTLQRWALFAEGPARYYIVEVDYVPAVSQSAPVWDDLQAYLDAFRVIQ
jgi:hypothetical protein